MNGGMTHEEVSELLGAFALDAVEVDDDAAIREHLDTCVRCESEVAQFHEVAGLLANAGGDAPQHLWERIAEEVEVGAADGRGGPLGSGSTPDLPSVEKLLFRAPKAASERKRRASRLRSPSGKTGLRFVVPLGTAAALIVIAVLGLQVDHLNHRIGQLNAESANQGLAQAVQAALLDPQAKQIA